MAIGEEPRRRLVRGALSGDHIARDGPGRAAKTNKSRLRRKSAFDPIDCLENRRKTL